MLVIYVSRIVYKILQRLSLFPLSNVMVPFGYTSYLTSIQVDEDFLEVLPYDPVSKSTSQSFDVILVEPPPKKREGVNVMYHPSW